MELFKVRRTVPFIPSLCIAAILAAMSMEVVASDPSGKYTHQGGEYDQSAYHGSDWDLDSNQWNRNHGNRSRIKVIRGITVTGVNNVRGRPAYDFGPPFGTFNFTAVGVYNEFGSGPLPLTEDTPDEAILATSVHDNFLFLAGKTRADVRPEWENVPLRNVPVNVDLALVEKQSLRGALTAEPGEFAQAEPSNPITLGQWMQASGAVRIACKGDERAVIKMRVNNMIPNRMYGVWALFGGQNPRAFPIGGVPNVFITDENGNATFKRVVPFCPLIVDEGEDPVALFSVQYHSEHENYGAVPEPVRVDGGWVGLVTHTHMEFPINVRVLDQ